MFSEDEGRYDIIYGDLWGFKKIERLRRVPVQDYMEKDCLLFLWCGATSQLPEAIDLGKEWGFSWATVAFLSEGGVGTTNGFTIETFRLCIVMKRGRIPKPRGARNVRQMLQGKTGQPFFEFNEAAIKLDLMFPNQRKLCLSGGLHETPKTWTVRELDCPNDLRDDYVRVGDRPKKNDE